MSASKAGRSDAQRQADQRVDLVGRLAGGIAHDLNNALTVVQTYCEFLEDHFEPGHAALKDIDAILEASRFAAVLSRQLLAFSRKEAAGAKVVDANDILLEMQDILKRLVGEDIDVALELTARPCPVRVDPLRLEQALLNLCVDAREAMPRGGSITIQSSLEGGRGNAKGENGKFVVLDVRERANPRPEGELADSDRQGRHGREGEFRRQTTAHIIDLCAGQLETDLGSDTGRRFTIRLPFADSRDSRVVSSSELTPTRVVADVVLVVEDDDAVRFAAHRALENAGHRVLVAKDASEAFKVARLHNGKVRVVLTDVVLPGLSGPEFVAQLEAQGSKVRVVYMSGYPHARWPELQETPAAAFVRKPFRPQTLVDAVRAVLA